MKQKFVSVLSLIAMAVMAAFVMVACEKPTPEPDPEPDPDPEVIEESVKFVLAEYYGDYYGSGSEDVLMVFSSEGMEFEDGVYKSGSGYVAYVDVLADVLPENLIPPTGEYPVGEDLLPGTAVVTGQMYNQLVGSYVLEFTDGVNEPSFYYVEGGNVSLKVDGDNVEMTADFEIMDNEDMRFLFSGEVSVTDRTGGTTTGGGTTGDGGGDYSYEVDTAGVDTFTFNTAQFKNYGQEYNTENDYIFLYMLNDLGEFAEIELYAPKGTTSPVGTYTINDTKGDWTCYRSPGGDSQYDYPSYIGYDVIPELGGFYGASYYLMSGTVEVTETGITIDFVSYNGSEIHAEYDGAVAFDTETESLSVRRYAPRAEVTGKQARMMKLTE